MKLLYYVPLILLIISLSMAKKSKKSKTKSKKPPVDDFGTPHEPEIGPKGMPYNHTTDCQTFGKYARFNPHSIVGLKWFVFYYWAPSPGGQLYQFQIPSKNDRKLLHAYLDGHLPPHFNWSANLVLRKELVTNETTLLEEKSDRGQYFEYAIYRGIPEGKLTFYRRVCIKQTGDKKYLAIMVCMDHTASIMARIGAVPPQKRLHDEAARLGYRGRKGKSYLYQGHEWMPIPEMDERAFWFQNRGLKAL